MMFMPQRKRCHTAPTQMKPPGEGEEEEADPGAASDPVEASGAVCRGSALCSRLLLFPCVLLFGGTRRLPGRITCS